MTNSANRKSLKTARGFTLVELLLAITLMSVLLALAYGGFRASTRATDRGQDILEESSRLRLAHQFVHRQLNQLLPMSFSDIDSDDLPMVFDGSSRSIRFVGPMPGYLGFGGPQVQELRIVEGENGQELVLTHALLQGFEEADLDARAPIMLIDGIQGGGFSFQGRDEQGGPGSWSDSWDETEIIPLAISLQLDFDEQAHMEWPDLVASVRIDGLAIAEMIEEAGGRQASEYSTTIQNLINRRGNSN
ncbi:MAG TPA: prepilin-type N-terminal cleavage/methylation domain-containing protein [Xanthomonadales bacterium]|nr:prepilin-type N-terminal cleavage/methylation domain-containing protein [Xanthomonadales bacterium]